MKVVQRKTQDVLESMRITSFIKAKLFSIQFRNSLDNFGLYSEKVFGFNYQFTNTIINFISYRLYNVKYLY